MDYIEIVLENIPVDQLELVMADLSLAGCNGFEELDNGGLKAYAEAGELNENELNLIVDKYQLNHLLSNIKEQNWNAVWESNFDPVQVRDFVGIRADFHAPIAGVRHEILITPKMSFGTGHHATTWMMLDWMEGLNMAGKSAYDFGTGTGVLAIMAEKLGAKQVLAVDNDDWCIENSLENIQKNNCQSIDIEKVETGYQNKKFDIILANVNRHIIEANIHFLVDALAPGGQILFSGLLVDDEQPMRELFAQHGLQTEGVRVRNNWISILCR